ncbi:MAG: hypothetical protein WAO71_11120 [Gallionella sp.]
MKHAKQLLPSPVYGRGAGGEGDVLNHPLPNPLPLAGEGIRALKLFALLLLSLPAHAETSWDGTLYGYTSQTAPRMDSVLNPQNQLAHIPRSVNTAEARFNVKWENDALRLTVRPIIVNQTAANQAYLSQWQLRLRASESVSLAAGREVLNWGAAQFRSPSSPFYFDNGRSNPMRELSGVDTVKMSWTPNMTHTLILARITGSGHATQNSWRNSWLLKADQRGDDWAGGVAWAHIAGQGQFLGAHAQYTARDEWLIYGEAGYSARQNALQSPSDPAQPFSISAQSPKRLTALIGAAYTLENGQSLNLEYLRDNHGYTPAQQSAYYARAAASPMWAGMALGNPPPLLGRDYLHLVWQSNLLDSGGYWRTMATHSLTDGSNELSAYTEKSLNAHLTAFAVASLPIGSARQEFANLLKSSVIVGVKMGML